MTFDPWKSRIKSLKTTKWSSTHLLIKKLDRCCKCFYRQHMITPITFSHFSDKSWVHVNSFHDVINHNAWVTEHYCCCFHWSVFTGSRCRVQNLVVSRGRAHVADVQYCLTPRTHFLVAWVIKEVVIWLWEESVVVEVATFSMKPSSPTF